MSISHETLVSGGKARRAFPRVPSEATYWRWLLTGVRGVKLESMKIGGRRYTSLEAIERFLTALNTDARSDNKSTPQTARVEAAKKTLDAMGI